MGALRGAGLPALAALLAAVWIGPAPVRAQTGERAVAAEPDTTGGRAAGKGAEADLEIDAQRRELEALGRELTERRERSRELKGREKSLLGQLKETEVQLSLTVRYLRALERRRNSVIRELGGATSELARTTVELEGDQRRLAWRLREIYKRGRSRDIEYLLSARSFADLMSRTYYLARIAREDRNRMLVTQAHRFEVQDEKARLEDRRRELDRLKAETERQRKSQKRLTDERRTLVTRIRSERKSNEQAAAELERASRRIQALIGQLEKKRLAAERGAPGSEPVLFGDFVRNKGRLLWPAVGKILRGFGSQKNPRFGTTTFNSGIDIGAPAGAPIAAVSKGRVDFVSWLDGYGKCAILNHGGGFYTLYAHASEILVAVGREVAAGEVIGRVGDTGSTIGTALHFEIRQGKTALNPLDWFR